MYYVGELSSAEQNFHKFTYLIHFEFALFNIYEEKIIWTVFSAEGSYDTFLGVTVPFSGRF